MRGRRKFSGGRAAVAATALLAIGSVPFLLSDGGADAAVIAPIVVQAGAETVYEGAPLVASNPLVAALNTLPDECVTPVGFCDAIPVKAVLPASFDPAYDYAFVTLEVTWDDPAGVDDIDLYLWNDEEGTLEATSISAKNPEKVSTELRNTTLVINHTKGVNLGYTVRGRLFIDTPTKPFELLEPTRPSNAGLPTGSPIIDASPGAATFEVPPADIPAIAPAGAGGAAVAKVDLVPAAGDSIDFDFERAQQELAAEAGEFKTVAASKDATGAGVWFWLVLLPVAVVAGGGAWLIRRSPTALKR